MVFRGSELSPGFHQLIAEVFHEAGLPTGVLNGPRDPDELDTVTRIVEMSHAYAAGTLTANTPIAH